MISESMKSRLKHLIIDHEGYKTYPYLDSLGKITIGIGYNLSDRGLPDTWINEQYEKDVSYFYNQLVEDFSWFSKLNETRQMILIDMCFMGYKKFKGFKRMLEALSYSEFDVAAFEMESSKWASQVKGRALQLAEMMRRGE